MDDPFQRLPEHILHHILSLLPSVREAGRTPLISRSWSRAWNSYPLFEFAYNRLGEYDDRLRCNQLFHGFVDSALSRHREHGILLPRLKIHTSLLETDSSPALFDKWIGMALDDGARDLELNMHVNYPWSYSVPARVLSSATIKTLALIGGGLGLPLGSVSTVNMSSLQSLKLSHTTALGDHMFQKLLQGCPLLEKLELCVRDFRAQIVISGLNKLRSLHIFCCLGGGVDRVQVEAPSLEKLEYAANLNGVKGHYADPTSVLFRCPKLKDLTYMDNTVTCELFQDILSNFPLLQTLRFGACDRVQRIRISNPLLEEIEIAISKNLEVEISAPKLSSLHYKWSYCSGMRLPFIRMGTPTVLRSLKAEVINIPDTKLPEWFNQLQELLVQSCTYRSLSINVLSEEGERDLQLEVDDPLPSLRLCIDQLDLHVRGPQSRHATVLNTLFSACHPTILQTRPSHAKDFFKSLCEKLANQKDESRCLCSSHIKCWLHELKGVEIEGITRCNHRGPLDWCTLFNLLPTLTSCNVVTFRLHW